MYSTEKVVPFMALVQRGMRLERCQYPREKAAVIHSAVRLFPSDER